MIEELLTYSPQDLSDLNALMQELGFVRYETNCYKCKSVGD